MRFIDSFIHYLPNLVAALVILVAGWLVAYLARWVVLRFGTGLDALLAAIYRRMGRTPVQLYWNVSRVVANIIFWIVILFSLTATSDVLGLVALAEWLRQLAFYLPRLLIAGVILVIGYMLSGFLKQVTLGMAGASGLKYGTYLSRVVTVLIYAMALLLALEQLGLNVLLLTNIFTLAVAGVFGGAAIAFGLGAGDSIRNILSCHQVKKHYRPGQWVRIQELEGQITELTPTTVVVETDEGSAHIPARLFSEQVTLLLDETDESDT